MIYLQPAATRYTADDVSPVAKQAHDRKAGHGFVRLGALVEDGDDRIRPPHPLQGTYEAGD